MVFSRLESTTVTHYNPAWKYNSGFSETADCVIIGGGIIGCAIAYYLSQKSFGKIILCEKNSVSSGNTNLAAALLTRPREKKAVIPLVQETYGSLDFLADELDEDLNVHRVGSLHLASSGASVSDLEKLMNTASEFSLDYSWLNGIEVHMEVPWISGEEIRKAAFVAGDAYLDPSILTGAYASSARRRGVTIRQNCGVKKILKDKKGSVAGVDTHTGKISSPVIVDSAGVWSIMIAFDAGLSIPAAPVRSNYWITAPSDKVNPDHPIVIMPDARAYARPDIQSILFGIRGNSSKFIDPRMLPDDINGFPIDTIDERWDMLIDGVPVLQRFIPDLSNIQISHYFAGLSAYTPDGLFIIGEIPGFKGFFTATGFSGAGIAAAGGAGRIVSELITGETPFCSITEFKPERFGKINPLDEMFMKRCADARTAKISG